MTQQELVEKLVRDLAKKAGDERAGEYALSHIKVLVDMGKAGVLKDANERLEQALAPTRGARRAI